MYLHQKRKQTLGVKRGDLVEAGDLLAHLESGVEEAQVAMARDRAEMTAAVDKSRIRFELAKRNLERSRRLGGDAVLSERQMDEAVTEERLAEAVLREALEAQQAARLALLQAEARRAQKRIESPVRGVVVERLLSPGDLAAPPQLVRVAEIHPLLVEVLAPAEAWGSISVGSSAEVLPADPVGGRHAARVTAVDRVIDSASGIFGVRLELPNSEYAIPAGLGCRVRFGPTPATSDGKASNDPIVPASVVGTLIPPSPRTPANPRDPGPDGAADGGPPPVSAPPAAASHPSPPG